MWSVMEEVKSKHELNKAFDDYYCALAGSLMVRVKYVDVCM